MHRSRVAAVLLVFIGVHQAAATNIIFRNDLGSDGKGDSVKIDQVRTSSSVAAMPILIRPGQMRRLSKQSVISFRVVRHRGQGTGDLYQVECPAEGGKAVTIKLLDVHSNHMPAGCATTKTGFWTSEAGYVWKK